MRIDEAKLKSLDECLELCMKLGASTLLTAQIHDIAFMNGVRYNSKTKN